MIEDLDGEEPTPPPPKVTSIVHDLNPSGELAVASAVMGGANVDEAKLLPADAFEDAEARALWTAFCAGVAPDDIFALHEKTKLTIPRILEIGNIDRAGASFSIGLGKIGARHREKAIRRLAGSLSERPDLASDLLPQISALAADSGGKAKALPAKGAAEFGLVPRSDKSCLLGNRWLNRGDGAILASNSGMGKSSMMLQMAVMWGLGLDFMGIEPNGPLRSLIIQSEDSEGDIAEVMASIAHAFNFGPKELNLINLRVKIVSDRTHRGSSFIRELGMQVKAHQPDLVWINPLAAFADGDMAEAREAGVFLREHLNGLNAACQFAYFIVTHTTKPATGKDKGKRAWNEMQYNMAGSFDLVGWARATVHIEPTEEQGEFNLVLAKRGSRADVRKVVTQDNGIEKLERTTVIPLRHAKGFFTPPGAAKEIPLVVWEKREPSAEEASFKGNGRPQKYSAQDFAPIFATDPAKGEGIRVLHRKACEIWPLGTSAFVKVINDAVAAQYLTRDMGNPKQPRYYLNLKPKE